MGYTPPYLEVRKAAGTYNVYAPSSTSTDDLTIFPNTTDATAYLQLLGLGGVRVGVAGGTSFLIKDAATEMFRIYYATPDCILESLIADKNIFLKPNGTGKIKFGDYTAGAATDSTGYITILDAAGNTRKLMVQA